jgi:hypothetical protein
MHVAIMHVAIMHVAIMHVAAGVWPKFHGAQYLVEVFDWNPC